CTSTHVGSVSADQRVGPHRRRRRSTSNIRRGATQCVGRWSSCCLAVQRVAGQGCAEHPAARGFQNFFPVHLRRVGRASIGTVFDLTTKKLVDRSIQGEEQQ